MVPSLCSFKGHWRFMSELKVKLVQREAHISSFSKKVRLHDLMVTGLSYKT